MPPNVGSSRATHLDDHVGIVLLELDVEDVDVGEPLEQDPLPFHDRLAGLCADVAEAEDRRPVRHDRDEVPFPRVLVRELGVFRDLETGIRHAGRIGERQIALRRARLRRDDLEFSLPPHRVIVEGVLLADAHGVGPLPRGF